jgi:hypothetical protein
VSPQERSLVIIAPARAAFREVEALIGESNFEVYLDRRRGDRRHVRLGLAGGGADRRRRQTDRRAFDISDRLQTMGWALIPADQRTQ